MASRSRAGRIGRAVLPAPLPVRTTITVEILDS